MLKQIIINSILIFIFSSIFVFAVEITGNDIEEIYNQSNKSQSIDYKIKFGVNTGASTPIPISNRLSNFSWKPTFCPFTEINLAFFNKDSWGFSTGAKIEYKGMDISANVYQLYTEVEIDNLLTKGYFTGSNETFLKVGYFTIPLCINYNLSNFCNFNLGTYASIKLAGEFKGAVKKGYIRVGEPTGERTDVEINEFDFSDEIRTFNFGIIGGFCKHITKKIYFDLQLNWAVNDLLNANFTGISYDLYNVYASIGVCYKLK